MKAKYVLQVIGTLQADLNRARRLNSDLINARDQLQSQLDAAFKTMSNLQADVLSLSNDKYHLERKCEEAKGAIGQRDGAIQEAHRLKAKLDALERGYDEIEEARQRNAQLYHAEVKKNQELEDKIAGLKGDCIEMADAMKRMELEMKQEQQ